MQLFRSNLSRPFQLPYQPELARYLRHQTVMLSLVLLVQQDVKLFDHNRQ